MRIDIAKSARASSEKTSAAIEVVRDVSKVVEIEGDFDPADLQNPDLYFRLRIECTVDGGETWLPHAELNYDRGAVGRTHQPRLTIGRAQEAFNSLQLPDDKVLRQYRSVAQVLQVTEKVFGARFEVT